MSIEQAKAIAEISQVVINSAKVEVEFAKANGGNVGFLGDAAMLGVTVHRLRG